ncbi:DUF3775 domain-containing protein [Pelagibacterium halotolerans]|uniref:DUF3775 domain-containing protein n=1 Tax=Pelagibacterium halotolerans TaxID=531813 RepID=UPI00384E8AD4
MDELTIDPGYLRELILKVRALMVKEDLVTPDIGDNPTDDARPEALQEWEGDLSYEEVVEELEGLDDDQLAELVALMWLGRGTADAEDWEETVQLARERHEGSSVTYLLGHPLVADEWAAGLEMLGHGTRVLEEGDY